MASANAALSRLKIALSDKDACSTRWAHRRGVERGTRAAHSVVRGPAVRETSAFQVQGIPNGSCADNTAAALHATGAAQPKGCAAACVAKSELNVRFCNATESVRLWPFKPQLSTTCSRRHFHVVAARRNRACRMADSPLLRLRQWSHITRPLSAFRATKGLTGSLDVSAGG